MNGYTNDYDEKVLDRSRVVSEDTRNGYVDWAQYTEQADYRPLIWVASILIVTLVIWTCVTLAQ